MPAFRSIISINIGMTCSALVKSGTAEQKAHWLPRLAAGEIASFGLTEPGSGSDSAAMATTAVRSGNGYVLNGTKRYITNAPFARVALIMARTNKEALPKNAHVSAFLVPMDTPGISVGTSDKKMGQAGSHIADIIMEDVHVSGDALLGGEEGKGFQTAMQSLDNGRLSVAAAATGYARRMLDTAIRYANERKAFGEPIANFQLIQAMLADSETEIYAAECMIADATRRADAGENILRKAAAAKMFASEMCGRVADRCVQIHGGAGYLAEYEAERFFRDARIYRIYEGTTQILQLVIAKNMLREFGVGV
jgi:acyl-CoA dehydrogenase